MGRQACSHRIEQGVSQGTHGYGCCGNPEESSADPPWSIKVGFLEEGTAGVNSYQDWDELKIHVWCTSQQERQETQAAFKKERGDACPSVSGEGGWKSFLECVKLSGKVEISQADLKTWGG